MRLILTSDKPVTQGQNRIVYNVVLMEEEDANFQHNFLLK
jgi:hypothetical protein